MPWPCSRSQHGKSLCHCDLWEGALGTPHQGEKTCAGGSTHAMMSLEPHTPQTSSACLTGLVVESGEGCTHVIPLVDGFLLASGIRSMPLGGAELTRHVQALMRKGPCPPPPHQSLEVAAAVKERYCCVAASASGLETVPGASSSPAMHQTVHSRWGGAGGCTRGLRHSRLDTGVLQFERSRSATPPRFFPVASRRTGQPLRIQLGEERWRGPELFFDPSAYTKGDTVERHDGEKLCADAAGCRAQALLVIMLAFELEPWSQPCAHTLEMCLVHADPASGLSLPLQMQRRASPT